MRKSTHVKTDIPMIFFNPTSRRNVARQICCARCSTRPNSLAIWGRARCIIIAAPPSGVQVGTLDHTRSLDPEWSGPGFDSASTNPSARSAVTVRAASKMRSAQRSEGWTVSRLRSAA
jgi:hypothetical protein